MWHRQEKPLKNKVCEEANLSGFPTWDFKGDRFKGEQELQTLADILDYKVLE